MQSRILLQVTAPALVTAVLLIGASVGSTWSIHRLQANLGNILSENVASVQASVQLQNSMRQLRYRSLLYLVRPGADILHEIEEAEGHFNEALELARGSCNTPEEDECLARIEAGYSQYQE